MGVRRKRVQPLSATTPFSCIYVCLKWISLDVIPGGGGEGGVGVKERPGRGSLRRWRRNRSRSRRRRCPTSRRRRPSCRWTTRATPPSTTPNRTTSTSPKSSRWTRAAPKAAQRHDRHQTRSFFSFEPVFFQSSYWFGSTNFIWIS